MENLYTVVIEPSATGYGAYSPDVPGCIAAGTTVEETLTLFREALMLHLEDLVGTGVPLPEAHGIALHWKTNRPSPKDLIAFIPVEEVAPKMPA